VDRVGEVIAKLAKDAYFMMVDNRVTQVPPVRTHEPIHHEVTSRSPADGGRNRTHEEQTPTPTTLGSQLEDPPRVATVRVALAVTAAELVAATVAAEAAAAGAHHMVLAEEVVAAAIVEAEAIQTATSPATHVAAMMPATE
jgi:hypothetical protein